MRPLSGRLTGKVKLSKCGAAALRQALYLAALSVRNRNPVLRQYYLHKLAVLSKNSSGTQDALTASLVVFPRLVYTPC